jgi:hypothetical protein
MTKAGAARRLGVSAKTVHRWIAELEDGEKSDHISDEGVQKFERLPEPESKPEAARLVQVTKAGIEHVEIAMPLRERRVARRVPVKDGWQEEMSDGSWRAWMNSEAGPRLMHDSRFGEGRPNDADSLNVGTWTDPVPKRRTFGISGRARVARTDSKRRFAHYR